MEVKPTEELIREWQVLFINDARLVNIIKLFADETREAYERKNERVNAADRFYEADIKESTFQMQLRMAELTQEIISERGEAWANSSSS